MPLPDEIVAEFDRAADGPITVDITTIGRSTGELRRIEIWILKIGERVVIGGTPRSRERDWLANVVADPRLIVHLKDDVVADVQTTATLVTDADVRREIWTAEVTGWYRGLTSADELIAKAPTVELHFD